MTQPLFRSVVVMTCALGCLAGCGCGGPQERPSERGSAADSGNRFEAWGASFELSPGWSGGENQEGGYEYTDGRIALMVGRHRAPREQSLEQTFDERRRALSDLGELTIASQRERPIDKGRAIELRANAATDGGSVEIRLLVVRLGAEESLSLMMIADAGEPRLDGAWSQTSGSLRLP